MRGPWGGKPVGGHAGVAPAVGQRPSLPPLFHCLPFVSRPTAWHGGILFSPCARRLLHFSPNHELRRTFAFSSSSPFFLSVQFWGLNIQHPRRLSTDL